MFGRSVFSLIFLFYLNLFAAQKGTVVAEEAYVYVDPDFDAQVIATAKRGEIFDMSQAPQGPFYKIRMKDKRLGWISSVDIEPGVKKLTTIARKNAPLESHTEQEKAFNTFAILRYQGFFLQNMIWKEKTLGKTRKDQILFFGWNWTGFDTLIEGPFYLDTRVMMSFQVPDYYKKVTGYEASGWALKAQTSFVSANPVGENFLFHYGLGLITTYSHFNASLTKNGVKSRNQLEDLTLGLVIPLGLSYRIGRISTQVFYQYDIEKIQSAGYSLGLNWQF